MPSEERYLMLLAVAGILQHWQERTRDSMPLDPPLEICSSGARDQSMAALLQILLPVVREEGQ